MNGSACHLSRMCGLCSPQAEYCHHLAGRGAGRKISRHDLFLSGLSLGIGAWISILLYMLCMCIYACVYTYVCMYLYMPEVDVICLCKPYYTLGFEI